LSPLLALALSVACAAAAQAKTLTYCSEGSPEGFDPAVYTTTTTMDASAQTIYNRLVEFVKGGNALGPGLADSWDISADGLEYTFHLHRGVRFQTTAYFTPTRDVNADDVIFTFERQWKTNNAYFNYAGGDWTYFAGMSMGDLLKSITRIDDYTVKFTLTRPYAPILSDLAMDFASIVSKEYADKLTAAGHKDQFNTQPVGTGPFQLADYTKDQTVHYTANPTYFRGKQPIDDLVFAITVDPAMRWQKLQAGDCNVMAAPNPGDLPAIKATAGITLLQQPALNVAYLAYNTLLPPFDNPAVRKALNLAVDRQAIVDAVYRGAAVVAKNPFPPTVFSYDSDIQDDSYDPAAAKQMLADAGAANLHIKLWAMPVPRSYDPNGRRIAEMIQANLAAIGVTADIYSVDWATYVRTSADKIRDGPVEYGWTGDNADPDNFLTPLLGCDSVGGANRANWCNPDFEAAIRKAQTSAVQDDRAAAYDKAQQIFKDQAPWLTIAHTLVSVPMQSNVTGFKLDPPGHMNFEGVDLGG
jgi:dipeptide transport system substrate-binding protein